MEQDYELEAERREQPARTRDAAKPDAAGKSARKHIDPERLYKAIRFLKAHPEQQVRQFQLRISDHDPPTMRGAYYEHAEHYFRSISWDPAVKLD
jgi:predicted glycosyltransferase